MVNALPKKYDPYVFNPNPDTFRANLCNLKRRLSVTQKNPRLKQIHLHTFRHFFATEKLKQTKMESHVQHLLGHKSITSTERYMHLVDYTGDKYYSTIAKTVDEIRRLAEDGWSYFQEIDGIKIFRKPRMMTQPLNFHGFVPVHGCKGFQWNRGFSNLNHEVF